MKNRVLMILATVVLTPCFHALKTLRTLRRVADAAGGWPSELADRRHAAATRREGGLGEPLDRLRAGGGFPRKHSWAHACATSSEAIN